MVVPAWVACGVVPAVGFPLAYTLVDPAFAFLVWLREAVEVSLSGVAVFGNVARLFAVRTLD